MSTPGDIWDRHAETWEFCGPPLRPGASDCARFAAVMVDWCRQHGTPRVMVLGVTPELVRLNWPVGTRLISIDHNYTMIRRIWPGYPGPLPGSVVGEWLRLPLAPGSQDLVFGDGVFNLLKFPEGHAQLLSSIRQVLGGRGLCVIRCFVRPETPERPRQVLDDLWAGRIGNFHVFKLRLAMSHHERTEQGVRLNDIWEFWRAAVDPHELATRLSWSPEVIATIDNYRGLETCYAFATLREIRSIIQEEFIETQCHLPTYELGERCPILALRPRRNAGAQRPIAA